MPRKGYKTITVREELYNELYEEYKKSKSLCLKKGITTFTGYIAYRLNNVST